MPTPLSVSSAYLLLVAAAAWPVHAADLLTYDFEQGADLARYPRLDLSRAHASIVVRDKDGKDAKPPRGEAGHCLRLETPQPDGFCAMDLKGPVEVQKNLILAFDHREEIEPGFEGAYLGMSWYVGDKQAFWSSDQFSGEWRRAQVEIGKLTGSWGFEVKPGLTFSRVQLYGRVKEKTEKKGETKAKMTVWFDNVRLYTGHVERTVSERTRTSYSNPPLFNWPVTTDGGGQKLQYSQDATFPENASVTVEVQHNFYLPPSPVEPGAWYWRVWSQGDLYDGWSEAEIVNVLPEAHRFVTQPVPVEELAKQPHPRLLELAKVDQPEVTEARKAQLVRSAESLYKQGVPEHPGPHVPGDPRWPTWIDWYGKVAGSITGGTGRRLQTLAQDAMLTGDPKVIGWAKELALEACKWDPEGGSAMKLGDIGAHHLLRGLTWCYDVCRDSMTDQERDTLKKIIVQRAKQFDDALNPFRGGEANNHAWLKAHGLGEAGLVLLGDYDQAGDWAEYVRELYLGRFLCCLGYQGDNNEGLSYWSYGLSFIIDYGDLMKAVCGIDLFQHPWLKQTARFPLYCAPPNAWAVSFADTGMPNHGARGPYATRYVRDLAVRTGDPYALWYSGERDPVAGLVPKPPVDLPQSIHYRHIGWSIFNTSLVDGREGVTVAMHSGQYQAGHQHPDQNSFVLNAYGEKLAIDGGYYDWYGSPHFKGYSMTTLAHNTLLVDGQGQAACKNGADGRVTAYCDSPAYGYTVGDAADPDVYGGSLKQFERRVLFIKPGFVVIHDLVAANVAAPAEGVAGTANPPAGAGSHEFDWLLHAVKPIEVDKATRAFSLECEKVALRGRFLAPANAVLEVKTGFPVEPVNRYSTNPVPKENYFPEWVLHASPEQPVQATEFLAAMQVQRRGGSPDPAADIAPAATTADNALAVRIKCGDRTHTVLFRKRDATGTIGTTDGLVTDGAAAAIETAGGECLRAFVTGGTFLELKGVRVLQSEEPQDWAVFGAALGQTGPIEGAWAQVEGVKTALAGYQRLVADTMLRYWWGQVSLPRPDSYEVAFEGWTEKSAPELTLDGQAVELQPGPNPTGSLWMQAGTHLLSIAGTGTFEGLTLKGRGIKLAPAKLLPKDAKLPADALVIEAEKPSAQGEVKGLLVEKVGASGGLANGTWDTGGQWAEWQFEIANPGDYELLIRGCSEHEDILRELLLDGQPLSPEVGVARFAATGGWCRTTDDWRYFLVCAGEGKPARISLTAGKHVIRMVQRGGSMNLDLLAWQPAK